MPSTQHKDLIGDDLHVSKIDPDTGTELTPPAIVILDTRYINEGQAAGGDLSGTFSNPTIAWANGYPTLDSRYHTEAETDALIATVHTHANKAQLDLSSPMAIMTSELTTRMRSQRPRWGSGTSITLQTLTSRSQRQHRPHSMPKPQQFTPISSRPAQLMSRHLHQS